MLTALMMTVMMVPPTEEQSWQLEQVRRWLGDERGPGKMGEAPEALPGAKALAPTSAEYKQAATAVPRGCALTAEPPPELPDGRAWELDLNGDGTPERLFTGGCSPDPYYEVLRLKDGRWAEWRPGRGRLLDVQRRPGSVVLVSASDGYGVSREAFLWLQRLAFGGEAVELRFSVVGPQPQTRAPKVGEECVVGTTAKLRSGPAVDDAPHESGMGFDWPGNLVQVLAKGSRGWAVGKAKGWTMCAFPAPAEVEEGAQVKAMRTPAVLVGSAETKNFVVGWVQGAK